jgi:hypothetical protein
MPMPAMVPYDPTLLYPDDIISTVTPGTTLVVSSGLKQHVAILFQRMDALPQIVDQGTFDAMRSLVKDAHALTKMIEAQRQLAKEPFLRTGQAIDAAAKVYLNQLNVLVQEGKSQETAFLVERDKLLREQEERRRAAEAEAAKDTSRPTAPLVPLTAPLEAIKAPLMTHRRVVIVNEALIPGDYYILDMQRLEADALAGVAISGVTVVEESIVVAR